MSKQIEYKITTTLPSSVHSYDIEIGTGIAGSYIAEHVSSGGFIVCDENISKLYDLPLGDRCIVIHASEQNKTLATVEQILTFLKDNGALRDSRLLALGGGIIGDITGFVASLYMRGIKFIQMPTTFLSMVDSSVGGKTGVNLGGIKNNIGAFNQPEKVVIDVDFLRTLTKEELLNGLVESIKISATFDKDLFDYIKASKEEILAYDSETLAYIINKSCDLKRIVVENDEKESGIRKLLNFGHTIAHAVESDSDHAVKHGYAVAIGMVYEMRYGVEHGHTGTAELGEIVDILQHFGYSIEYVPQGIDKITKALSKDKKATLKGISLALTGASMQGSIIDGVLPSELIELFK